MTKSVRDEAIWFCQIMKWIRSNYGWNDSYHDIARRVGCSARAVRVASIAVMLAEVGILPEGYFWAEAECMLRDGWQP